MYCCTQCIRCGFVCCLTVAQKDVGAEGGDRVRSPELRATAIKSDNEEYVFVTLSAGVSS